MLAFKVMVLPYCCNQHTSTRYSEGQTSRLQTVASQDFPCKLQAMAATCNLQLQGGFKCSSVYLQVVLFQVSHCQQPLTNQPQNRHFSLPQSLVFILCLNAMFCCRSFLLGIHVDPPSTSIALHGNCTHQWQQSLTRRKTHLTSHKKLLKSA